jgi:uncharacterized protein (DUF3820 family)
MWAELNSHYRRNLPWFNYNDYPDDTLGKRLLDLAIRIPMKQVRVLVAYK